MRNPGPCPGSSVRGDNPNGLSLTSGQTVIRNLNRLLRAARRFDYLCRLVFHLAAKGGGSERAYRLPRIRRWMRKLRETATATLEQSAYLAAERWGQPDDLPFLVDFFAAWPARELGKFEQIVGVLRAKAMIERLRSVPSAGAEPAFAERDVGQTTTINGQPSSPTKASAPRPSTGKKSRPHGADMASRRLTRTLQKGEIVEATGMSESTFEEYVEDGTIVQFSRQAFALDMNRLDKGSASRLIAAISDAV